MKKKLLLLSFLVATFFVSAQNIAINNTGALPNASAMLDITSNNKGLLIPRVALTATNDNITIASPSASLLIYNTASAGSGSTTVTPGFYYWSGSGWIRLITDGSLSSSGWLLGGNSSTNPSINFIGTTDAQPLIFKINNVKAGIIDSIPYNTGIGFRTFDAAPTGTFNTAFGYKSLMNNTTGGSNTALGSNALRVNTSGYSNTAVGNLALFNSTDRSHLVAIGDSALLRNGLGVTQAFEAMDNTAVGSKALFSNTTGYSNTAMGTNALYNNTTAPLNSAFGYYALSSNINGFLNTAIGSNALLFNSAGSLNTGVGSNSLYLNNGSSNTAIGAYSMEYNLTGSQNTSIGTQSLNKNTNGSENTVLGYASMLNNTTGYRNTTSGTYTLFANTTGYENTALGYYSLNSNTTGSSNTAVGAYALQNDTSGYANTASGYFALNKNTNGILNTATGVSALVSNTTGQANSATGAQSLFYNTTGSSNSGHGFNSLYKNVNGSNNTANGVASLNENTSGNYNTASGSLSLYNNSSGNFNSALGASSLSSNTTGTNNTGLGYHTDVISGNLSNATAIGANSRADCSNCMVLGSINTINGAVSGVNVGIGTTIPSKQLEVVGAASATPVTLVVGNRGGFGPAALEFVSDYGISSQWRPGYIRSNDGGGFTGVLQFYTNGSGSANLYTSVKGFEINNGVAYTASGTVSSFSDARLKRDITPFTDGLNVITRINPVNFYYNEQSPFNTNRQQVGVVAQQLEKVAPYMVHQTSQNGISDIRSVDNQAYIFLLINAVKEQQKEIEELKRQVNQFMNK
jgi:hypothetical protein